MSTECTRGAVAVMLCKTIRRSVIDSTWTLPPVYLLPCRARFFTTVSHTIEADPIPAPLIRSDIHHSQHKTTASLPNQGDSTVGKPPQATEKPPPTSPPPSKPTTPLSDSIKELLPLLKAQASHYITTHIYGRPYLLTQGDILRLPFHMHGVNPGDVLRLNRASNIGSRDYTLKAAAPTPPDQKGTWYAKGQAYLDERLFECRAVVLGTESEPMRIKEKTKRRQRRVKKVKSKHRFTVLRVKELRIKGLDEIEAW